MKLYSKLVWVGHNVSENCSAFLIHLLAISISVHFEKRYHAIWLEGVCVCLQSYPLTESSRQKFIYWQLIVRIAGRGLKYLHKVFHCGLSECESIKTQEIHIASCRKLILFLSFLYLQAIFASPLSIPEHNITHKRPESVCSVQHFCLFITGGRKKGLNLLQLVGEIWFCPFYLTATETVCTM